MDRGRAERNGEEQKEGMRKRRERMSRERGDEGGREIERERGEIWKGKESGTEGERNRIKVSFFSASKYVCLLHVCRCVWDSSAEVNAVPIFFRFSASSTSTAFPKKE